MMNGSVCEYIGTAPERKPLGKEMQPEKPNPRDVCRFMPEDQAPDILKRQAEIEGISVQSTVVAVRVVEYARNGNRNLQITFVEQTQQM